MAYKHQPLQAIKLLPLFNIELTLRHKPHMNSNELYPLKNFPCPPYIKNQSLFNSN
jgi:hypothetical protein